MFNNSQEERNALKLALDSLDVWFDSHDKVDTGFGEQYTINGYRLGNIGISPAWIKLDVYMLDRSINEKDEIRCGDMVYFIYYRKTNEIKLQE